MKRSWLPMLACLGVLAAPAPARAQAQRPAPARVTVRQGELMPLLIPGEEPVHLGRPAAALTLQQTTRLRHATDLRLSGLPDRARDTLQALLREVPHHGLVVTELARTQVARTDWNAVVSLVRAERANARDSVLASRELVLALERTARVREAIAVVVETWAASPAEGEWALPRLLQFAPSEPRASGEAVRAALVRLPARSDLALTLALLQSRAGESADAARTLAAADRATLRPSLRQRFADEALGTTLSADSAAAVEALFSLAADRDFDLPQRLNAARMAHDIALTRRPGALDPAARLAAGLADIAPERWGQDLLLGVARELRESGRTSEANALLARAGALARHVPELALEQQLSLLREGPPARAVPGLDSLARAWPDAMFPLAEAEFFSGALDSALAHYQRAAADIRSPRSLAALERAYLLEEEPGSAAARMLGEIAYARWRGAAPRARAMADSLHRALLPASPLYAHAALAASELRDLAGDRPGALLPLLAVADSLPGDRLAPLARQRAGEVLLRMGDARRALAQFEECLARYPRAWNAPEVRRRVEQLRKESRL